MADQDTDWAAVIGRSLAQFSLDAGPAKDGDIGDKARFLAALGLSKPDIAAMLNSTAGSVKVLLGRKKRAKRNGGKKKSK
jgi:hypothetical protein